MKYITFTIPSYNSQDYMRHVIDNLVAGGDDIEVIIVNDGTKDNSVDVINKYLSDSRFTLYNIYNRRKI